jgi:hypothetical protein
VLLLALAAQATAEEKVQVPYRDILACAQAANCTNMTKSGITWYDQVGLAVITFEEDGRKYALKSTGTRLSVWLTVPGDRAPSRLVSLDSNGALRSGELGPQTADSGPRRRTPDEMAAWRQTHKVFNSGVDRPGAGVLGEEFRPFWQALADQALAAIRRQMSK